MSAELYKVEVNIHHVDGMDENVYYINVSGKTRMELVEMSMNGSTRVFVLKENPAGYNPFLSPRYTKEATEEKVEVIVIGEDHEAKGAGNTNYL